MRCDQTIRLNSRKGRLEYPDALRRISYVDPESGQSLVFLTNQFELPALLIAQIFESTQCGSAVEQGVKFPG